jgi:iron(III) transport system substrate-binding protein
MKFIVASLLFLSSMLGNVFANEVNVFTSRHYESDIELYNKFTERTGIKVNVISGEDGALQKRIKEEDKDSKADLYITADAGKLGTFEAEGLFQTGASSNLIKSVVPEQLRTEYWVGIAKRARVIFYDPCKDYAKSKLKL